jgi:hypothetical protein
MTSPRILTRAFRQVPTLTKADGTQALDLQRDALLGAGIPASQLYKDHGAERTPSSRCGAFYVNAVEADGDDDTRADIGAG